MHDVLANWHNIKFVFVVFAVYRIAQLISIDIGPLGIFSLIRRSAKRIAGHWQCKKNLSKLLTWKRIICKIMFFVFKDIADGLECIYCVGMWVAIALSVTLIYSPSTWTNKIEVVLFIIGVSGMQSFLQEVSKWR